MERSKRRFAFATPSEPMVPGGLVRLIASLGKGTIGGDLVDTLAELSTAASNLGGAARQLDGMVDDLREPLGDFSGTGLYELTNLVGESRALMAALTRITKEVERDPAGFLIGGSRRGFKAECALYDQIPVLDFPCVTFRPALSFDLVCRSVGSGERRSASFV